MSPCNIILIKSECVWRERFDMIYDKSMKNVSAQKNELFIYPSRKHDHCKYHTSLMGFLGNT